MHYFRGQELMNGAEAPARKNEFPTDLWITAAHEAQQFDLLLRVGNIDLFNERFGLHDPREIRGAHATINDRTGDAESSGINPSPSEMFRSLAGKLLDD